MKGAGVFKVIGKSLYKVGKIATIGVASALLTYGPETANVMSQFDPKAAAIFTLAYTLFDAYKHRDKLKDNE